MSNVESISDVIEKTNQGQKFSLCLGDLLEDITYKYSGNKVKIAELIMKEPMFYEDIPYSRYVYCASAAHKIANDNEIEPPSWVFKSKYFSKEPIFASNAKGKLRLILLYESPAEFKFRNMYVSFDCMTRV